MKKRQWQLGNILLGTLLLLILCYVPTHAANPQMVTLEPGKTYTEYDVTGNGKADKITVKQLEMNNYAYQKFRIRINDKQVYTVNNYFFNAEVKLYTLKNNTPYLYIYLQQENDYGVVCGMFRYMNGKLKQVYSFQNLPSKYGANHLGKVESVNENTFCFQQQLMLCSTGVTNLYWNYTYKENELKKTSNICKKFEIYTRKGNKKTFTTKKSIQGYTSVAANKKSIKIPKNKKVKIKKFYVTKNKMMINVIYNGKKLWIKPSTSTLKPQFKGVVYAG